MENVHLNDLAKKAYNRLNEKAAGENYSIDPLTLLTIIHLLLKITELFLKWYTDTEDATVALMKLNVFKKGFIWYHVRKEEKDKTQARLVYSSIIESIQDSTYNELEAMFSFQHTQKGL